MAAVVSYWQLPDDEKEFFEFLQSTGKILVLPDWGTKTKEELMSQPVIQYFREHDGGNLGLEAHVRLVRIIEHEPVDGFRFNLPYMEPCMMNYCRGKLDHGRLALSNLCAYW